MHKVRLFMVGWLYTNSPNRYKTKVVKTEFGKHDPIWGFDGSSTEQAMEW